MAKKNKKNVAAEEIEGVSPETQETTETTETPKPKLVKKISYLLAREPGAEDKLCNQCSVVYQHIAKHCEANGKCDRDALISGITPEELKTRQEVSRIVAYYIPVLIKAGLITKYTETVEKPAETVENTAE